MEAERCIFLRLLFPVADVTEKTHEDIIKFIALLQMCTVATAVTAMCQYCSKLLYAIQILTVTISVHTVTNMYGSHSTVTVCN